MQVEPQDQTSTSTDNLPFASINQHRSNLELFRDIETNLRHPTVAIFHRFLSPALRQKLQNTSLYADEFFQTLAKIDIENINDWELYPARIYIGLTFVGFAALLILLLVLYINTFNPHLTYAEQVGKYWYQYILCVCLGVTGMFLIGREVIRYRR
ncbi:MAG: hypothetical protein EAZ76_15570 [Nostocales cyanobacterium]|nr:MAG: hypothetical protein EAZ87_12920 [Nostocales cyanobacterium]TAF10606.1 MAG: hypothetical protein EAZ76_15570 [Nostocales cyanobacterium]